MSPLETCHAPAAGASEPVVLGMRCLAAAPSTTFEWHSHSCFELVFVTQDRATIGLAPETHAVEPDTLLLHHPGESHAGWIGPRQRPRFWVLHFALPTEMLACFPRFAAGAERIWKLKPKQAETFRRMFLQTLNERMHPQQLQRQAEAAWLQLLLISVHRWISEDFGCAAAPQMVNSELMNLWQLVKASVGQPPEYLERIHNYPNYDSLRHGFKRAFGCSPRAMVIDLRIQHAKNLLLESNLSVKEIAVRCGYQRQHEFARAFRQQAGVSPTEWRLGQTDAVIAPPEFAAPAAASASRRTA